MRAAGQRVGEHLRHAAGQPQPGRGAGVLDDQLGQHRDGHGPADGRQPHDDGRDHPVVAVPRLRRPRRGAVVEPRRCPHLLAAPSEQGVVDRDGRPAPRPGTSSATTSLATARPSSSGLHRAREKNRCARSWLQQRARPAPASIPHTVRFPGWARNPQARPQNVRNDGAVNNGARPASSVISDAGTGSVASTSIGGNPFHRRFHKHRRCSLICASSCRIPRSHRVSRTRDHVSRTLVRLLAPGQSHRTCQAAAARAS